MTRGALVLVAACAALAACGEKPQSMGGVKDDATAYSGTGMPYAAPGWKQGDRTSWEQQLKVRTQSGQNDYVKVN